MLAYISLAQPMGHHYQLCPFGFSCGCGLIQLHVWKLDAPLLQLHVVNDQAAELHVQDFHAGQCAVDEDEGVTLLDVLMHLVLNDTAERVKALSHIRGIWIEVEVVGVA